MSVNLDQALQTYIAEARELLQDMEDALLRLENEPGDADTVGAIFRAAHTIKGSAGLFGLDAIVKFTHVVEDVLDRVRDGKVAIEADLIAVLLESSDHMLELINVVAAQGRQLDTVAQARESALCNRLQAYRAETKPVAMEALVSVEEDVPLTVCNKDGVSSDNWHISLRFGQNVLRDGMDPLSFLRYLGKLGKIVSLTTLPDAMPEAGKMDAETCYLGFEIDFKSDADKAAIANVFEFVREESLIHILPPHSKISDYLELIRALPESEIRVGEILVATGALTQQELADGLNTQKAGAQVAGNSMPLGKILVDQGSVGQEVVEAALVKQAQARDSKNKESKYIRVQADRLDELINLVGELVIAGAGANMLAQRAKSVALQESTSEISRLVEEIRDSALNLRMVQIGETFNRFQRVVRDVSRDLGKDIALHISGAETELDKTVVEKIGDPLMHLVRNAMDHGIENSVLRAQRGKPEKGTLRLNAYHESGSIVIEVSDDGGGLNRERILAKAVEKGIVAPNQNLSEQEIFRLIFEAGFSTADTVSNISGRGVGMDVVRRNIEALRGTIDIESKHTEGTTIRIRLPLTLAIIDGFLVGVGKSSFVIPLDMVLECTEMSEQDREALAERNYVNLRNEVLPFIRLRDLFDISGNAPRRENIVVVQYAGLKAGLVVDGLLGEFQTVIKPLGGIFEHLKGISGSTILGSGEVALILDVPTLVQRAVAEEDRQHAAA
ncbi:MAG: chemotaxis protein CheA [Gallionellales bacterium 35-53-114]|nr:MAG: chemotaxis protein CheA [Gallionellales bacterium 35-53-114]OYZ63811.1 MAG: chemotaxis protein CheA [Gallionellales bacterium 24-53-125]OZB09357.1 MAG: chemotaxis protein CheA [Gallionellales bacterium 39-52-133]HQS57987.1 chemotaxis protein CheA [Gallionellaceae bacterium]HQS76148.1 chemotaxis protein CheA [Gallionellaceae bacterium]